MIITEIQYFSSKIIRFQAIFKDTVEFTCALEFKISSQPLFTPHYTYSLLCYKIKHLLHIHHLHNIEKRSPRRFSPSRRPHRFLQRDHCICSLFRNGNGFSVSIPTTGTGLRSLFRLYIHLLYFNYAR